MLRTLLLFGYVAAGDALLVFTGIPLQRYALHAALQEPHNTGLILLLLAANVALLIVILTAAIAGVSGVRSLPGAMVTLRDRAHRFRTRS